MGAERSEAIEKLAEALALAQAKMAGARKDAENPHFKSRYADLASIWEACRGPLSANGLAVVQTTRVGEGGGMALVTTLLHTSGQWMSGEMPIGADPRNPQAVGSWLTYARRYALAAIAGIAPEDDDGAAAQGPPPAHQTRSRPERPRGRDREPEGLPDRQSINRDFPARSELGADDPAHENWGRYIGELLRRANGDWLREMTAEGIAPDVRREHRELANEPQVVNHLVSRLIELGQVRPEAIAKDGKPEVRDPSRARDIVRAFREDKPVSIHKAVGKYLDRKRAEARAALGMPDRDEGEGDPEGATEAAGAAS